jgi:chromosome segregation ATPase
MTVTTALDVRPLFSRLAALFREPQPMNVSAAIASMSFIAGTAKVRLAARPGSTIERRVETLEANLDALDKEAIASLERTTKRIDAIQLAFEDERRARTEADAQITAKLTTEAARADADTFVMFWWLLIGTVAGAIPQVVRLSPTG